MTPERAVAALERRIEALFASSRHAVGKEATAYLLVNKMPYMYVVFANGEEKAEGAAVRVCASLDEAVDQTVAAVAKRYPDASRQQVIWRRRCEYDEWPAADDGPLAGYGEWPAGWALHCRLVGVPL